jgi:hypothetical protein
MWQYCIVTFPSCSAQVSSCIDMGADFSTIYFIRVTIYSAILPYLPYTVMFAEVTNYPARVTALLLACIKAIIHITTLSFCHDIHTYLIYKRPAMQVFRFFTKIKFEAIYYVDSTSYFWTSQGHYWPLIDKVGWRNMRQLWCVVAMSTRLMLVHILGGSLRFFDCIL